jgi:phosphatidylserine decarboxylase
MTDNRNYFGHYLKKDRGIKMKIVKEGFRNIKFFAFWAVGFFVIGSFFVMPFLIFLSILFFILVLFSFYFFRNPDRKIEAKEDEILCPADGTVMEITEEYNQLLQQNCKVVRIFLSVFNVHVQRAPIDGKITCIQYKNGKFLPAMDPKAHIENEQNLVIFQNENPARKILCSQIAGLIARTIVMWKKEDDILQIGDLYGMIKFGSQVDVYMPTNVEIKVSLKQKVSGGKTILANWII